MSGQAAAPPPHMPAAAAASQPVQQAQAAFPAANRASSGQAPMQMGAEHGEMQIDAADGAGAASPPQDVGMNTTPAPARRRPGRQKRTSVLCQVPDCGAELVDAKGYYRRYHICKIHCMASAIELGGKLQRFCQQCGRFHMLDEFDGTTKSCREQLKRHNERRNRWKFGGGGARSSQGPEGEDGSGMGMAPHERLLPRAPSGGLGQADGSIPTAVAVASPGGWSGGSSSGAASELCTHLGATGGPLPPGAAAASKDLPQLTSAQPGNSAVATALGLGLGPGLGQAGLPSGFRQTGAAMSGFTPFASQAQAQVQVQAEGGASQPPLLQHMAGILAAAAEPGAPPQPQQDAQQLLAEQQQQQQQQQLPGLQLDASQLEQIARLRQLRRQVLELQQQVLPLFQPQATSLSLASQMEKLGMLRNLRQQVELLQQQGGLLPPQQAALPKQQPALPPQQPASSSAVPLSQQQLLQDLLGGRGQAPPPQQQQPPPQQLPMGLSQEHLLQELLGRHQLPPQQQQVQVQQPAATACPPASARHEQQQQQAQQLFDLGSLLLQPSQPLSPPSLPSLPSFGLQLSGLLHQARQQQPPQQPQQQPATSAAAGGGAAGTALLAPDLQFPIAATNNSLFLPSPILWQVEQNLGEGHLAAQASSLSAVLGSGLGSGLGSLLGNGLGGGLGSGLLLQSEGLGSLGLSGTLLGPVPEQEAGAATAAVVTAAARAGGGLGQAGAQQQVAAAAVPGQQAAAPGQQQQQQQQNLERYELHSSRTGRRACTFTSELRMAARRAADVAAAEADSSPDMSSMPLTEALGGMKEVLVPCSSSNHMHQAAVSSGRQPSMQAGEEEAGWQRMAAALAGPAASKAARLAARSQHPAHQVQDQNGTTDAAAAAAAACLPLPPSAAGHNALAANLYTLGLSLIELSGQSLGG